MTEPAAAAPFAEASSEGLAAAVSAGRADAMAELGERLLSPGHPQHDLQRAGDLVITAARAGDARAQHRAAVLAASAGLSPPDWPRTLRLLADSAQGGWAQARRELAILAAGPLAASPAGADDWAALARSVDLAAWAAAPPKAVLAEAPRIRALPGFAGAAVCDWLIGRAQTRLRPARVYAAEGQATRERARSNSEAEFDLASTDVVALALQTRIETATGLPRRQMEFPYVLHYQPGQEFTRHYDFLDEANPAYAREIATRGQRVVTFLLYLNAGFSGGETSFPLAGVTHKGGAGDAVMFSNVDRQGAPDPLTVHAGVAPAAGVKWLLSQFIRGAPGPDFRPSG